MRKFVRQNSLGLFFGVIFLPALVGQAFAGWKQFNDEQLAESLSQISLPQYLTSASFATDVAENWQSEYLQFLLYILATVWLLQRGSPECKELDRAGRESARDQEIGEHATTFSPRWARVGGMRTAVYSWSLGIVMGPVFLLSWFAQSLAGCAAFNETRLQRLQHPLSWGGYLLNADFWARTLQNWQPEFLAVGSMPCSASTFGNGARRRASL